MVRRSVVDHNDLVDLFREPLTEDAFEARADKLLHVIDGDDDAELLVHIARDGRC